MNEIEGNALIDFNECNAMLRIRPTDLCRTQNNTGRVLNLGTMAHRRCQRAQCSITNHRLTIPWL